MFVNHRSPRAARQRILVLLNAVLLVLLPLTSGGCPPSSELAGLEPPSSDITVEPGRGPTIGGTPVTILGRKFERGVKVLFGEFLSPQVEVVSDKELRVIVPARSSGVTDVALTLPGGTAMVARNAYEYVPISEADAQIISLVERKFPGAPRLVSAISLGPTRVRLTFSEPVLGSPRNDDVASETVLSSATGALDPSNYQIVIPNGGGLSIDDGRDLDDPTQAPKIQFNDDQTVVEIATLSQSAVDYVVTASGITDLSGKPISPPDILVNPAQATFRGIAPVQYDVDPSSIQVDRDGDGIADWFEMAGWDVTIELGNGVVTQTHVTSDPYERDTDCDGLSDSEENARLLDPRSNDTDADGVTDCDETRVWLSNPADQDTDDDGLADASEVNLNTSLVLADTDGDQLDDREEIVLRNRNPRLADLPLPQIRIGEMNLEIDERFTYTDEEGVEQSIESSTSQSFLQSDTTTLAESSTTSNTASESYSQEIQGGYGDGSSTGGWHFQVGVGFEQSQQRGYSSTISEESSRTAQQEYSESLAQALSTSERREVTRSVDGARLSVDVTVANAGDVSFTLSNLEVTARVQDPRHRDRFLPFASLVASSGASAINLGTLQSQRGPFVFENTEIFPKLAEGLLREPRPIIFDIANYDIIDEFGRNFAFTSEEINDLTAGILIDFGDGRVEQYRVATASEFIPLDNAVDQVDGCDECPAEGPRVAKGVTMRSALAEIGLARSANESDNLSAAELAAARGSFGTSEVSIDDDDNNQTPDISVERLTRVRDVQSDVENSPRDKRYWVVMTPTGEVSPTADFSDIMLHPRDDYQLWYTRDLDQDGLFARQEFLAGSSDESTDTDNDGLSDFEEIKTGWVIQLQGQLPYSAYPHPARPDTDFDAVADIDERRYGTDPRLQDTDEDGLPEQKELIGFELERFDDDGDSSNNDFIMIEPYTSVAIIEPCSGGDGTVSTTVLSGSDDIQFFVVGTAVGAGTPIIGAGANGIIDTEPTGDDEVSSFGLAIVASEDGTALTADDDDVQVATSGSDVDAGDLIATAGCDGLLQTSATSAAIVRAIHRDLFATDPLMVDTDLDGLSDGREELLGSDPNDPNDAAIDSDHDGLLDNDEINGWDVKFVHRHNACDGSTTCLTTVHVTSDPFDPDTDRDGLPDALEFALKTNPRLRDTDGDTLSDLREYAPDFRLTEYFGDDISDRLDAFERLCALSPDCSFTPAMNPIGSSPLDVDSDDDGLIDQFEVNGWMVDVVDNDPPFLVTSNPALADTDNDGLSDREEWRGADGAGPNQEDDTFDATDPREQDTDGDGVNDNVELSQNEGSQIDWGSRNPLRRDQLLRIDFDRFKVIRDCDNTGSSGDFQFRLYLRTQNGDRRTIVHSTNDRQDLGSGCGGSNQPCYEQNSCNIRVWKMGDGDEVSIPNSFRRTFVLDYDRTASVEVWWTERTGCNHDSRFPYTNDRSIVAPLGSDLDRSFEYNTTSGNACETRVDYKVQIITN
ncbi:MAG TPA: IPT/TIG domain-containing protein [Phycisphaerae bacterium]|nr:IPT/TIG domain-containing protein [Phycisphaerae bacterium]HRW52692.1 IPT/TIG domain-containing protein [Phycisphaerae bacterium]